MLKTPGKKKSMKYYRMVRKHDILTINNKERLIKPVTSVIGTILYCISLRLTNCSIFCIQLIIHGGRCIKWILNYNQNIEILRTKLLGHI